METSAWFLYTLRCADETLYTGVTTDLTRRVAEHNAGRGARYTAGRHPVRLVAAWGFPDRGAAQRAEARFRRLSRAQKLALVTQRLPFRGAAFCCTECTASLSETVPRTPARFCPHCGGSLETVVRPGDNRPRQICVVCGHVHYRKQTRVNNTEFICNCLNYSDQWIKTDPAEEIAEVLKVITIK